MATAAETIRLALRKLRVIGQGENPDSSAQTDALTELNNLLWGYLGQGGSLPFRDLYVDADYEVPSTWYAQRLLVKHSAALTITLPEGTEDYPLHDGFRVEIVDVSKNAATYNITVARNGWLIDNTAANYTINTSGGRTVFTFRADKGDWAVVANLTTASNLPFPAEFDGGIALILADRLSGEYGKELSRTDKFLKMHAENQIYARYCQIPKMYPDGGVERMGGATAWTARTGQDQSVA